tara:strand:+ start:413 stop:658 length:246 start_codon:yes stop_codon:yes gene_type:complete
MVSRSTYRIIAISILLLLSNCSTTKTRPERTAIDSKRELPTFKPGTYYNQHRPGYSPFEMYKIPTIETDRGSQYKRKPKND